MPKIQQLSPLVADMIAAGEVVERPASAAKELVENAIDAGAKNVTVEMKNGGMTFLRVTDDGCGMSGEDAETAFLRHATSKLREASDLEAISTLGFRGEALAAISAVSRVDLLTKTADATFGVSLHLEAGAVTERGEAGCPNGTTLIVRDLFYNTPARLKFMKRDAVEASALLSMVQRLALAHPEVSFHVLRDGEEQLHTVGDGKLYSALYAVLGRQLAQEMVPVESRYEKYTLTGFVTKPSATRGNRANQLFFVNGRHIRSKALTTALEEAYRNQLMVGRYPSCVLHLHLPEQLVDVNVHPAKTEVKFLSERDVFDCVRYGVQGALEHASGRVEMRLPGTAAKQKEPFFRQMSAADYRAVASVLKDSAPALRSSAAASSRVVEREAPVPPRGGQAPAVPVAPSTPERASIPAPSIPVEPPVREERPVSAARPAAEKKPVSASTVPTAPAEAHVLPAGVPMQTELPLPAQSYRIVGEVLDTYIIVEQEKTVLFIDKHAAHERILFEKLRANPEPVMSQLLLEPILCKPEREEAALLLENAALLNDCGFEAGDYGDGILAIRRIPAELEPQDAESALNQLASDLRNGKRADPKTLRDTMLHTVACKAAIKGGWHSEPQEREAIVRAVLSREDLKYCPHGRPICAIMTAAQLERQFKRA